MEPIDTITGEELLVAAHGHESVAISVRCRRFGTIAHVRLTHEQTGALASALTALALEHGAAVWHAADDP